MVVPARDFALFTFFLHSPELKNICNHFQPVNRNGGNTLLPPEGRSAAANLFALIVESELTGNMIICVCSGSSFTFHQFFALSS